MKQEKFSIKKTLDSFRYAFNGLKILIREEHNSRIHLFIAICVLIIATLLDISAYQWILLIFAIGFVFTTEIINTVIENMLDYISPEKHETIKKIKDLSASAVLLSALTALIIGLLIFIPELTEYLKQLITK